MKVLGPLAAVIALALPQASLAQGWGYLYGAVKLTTDYRFHGFSESNRRPTVQGNLHWVAPQNWYVGMVASGIDFRDGSTSYEIDLYGGRHFYFGDNDLNLEVLTYMFPDHAGPSPGYNAIQTSAELTHSFGDFKLAGKFQLKHAHFGQGFESDASASWALTPWLTASGIVGYQQGAKAFHRMNWDIGLAATWDSFVFDARYSGTDTPKSRCYYTNWCATGFSATITYQFGWSL